MSNIGLGDKRVDMQCVSTWNYIMAGYYMWFLDVEFTQTQSLGPDTSSVLNMTTPSVLLFISPKKLTKFNLVTTEVKHWLISLDK